MKMLALYDRLTIYNQMDTGVKFSMGYFERTFSFILFSWIYFKYYRGNKPYTIFYNSFVIYYCSYLLFYEVQVFVDRLPTLFIYSYWVLFPAAVTHHYKYSRVINLVVSALVVLKLLLSFNMRTGAYQNILWTTPDFREREQMANLDLES